MNMTDIHTHLIPDVDDGSEDLSMSLTMMLSAYRQGVRVFFATPHNSAFRWNADQVQSNFQALKENAARFFPDVTLLPGCEVKCDEQRMDAILSDLASGRSPSMNGTRYVLTEFSQWVRPGATMPCVEALVDAGWIPIIAHLERYPYLQGNTGLVQQFRDAGCLIQVNAYSLQEETDENIRQWARQLILDGKVDFLGTDAHRTTHRPPSAQTGLQWIYDHSESTYADALAFGNARNYLNAP